jgi:Family of unknown function (DUF6161)
MAEQAFTISYQQLPNVIFSGANAMKKYLVSEQETWAQFLESVRQHGQLKNIPTRYGAMSVEVLVGAFDLLLGRLGDIHQFNVSTQSYRNEVATPPPSGSLEGQLILGLTSMGRGEDAICAYFSFVVANLSLDVNSHQSFKILAERGSTLLAGAYAAAAVPFGKVSAQKLVGLQRVAEAANEDLKNEVLNAGKVNEDHAAELKAIRQSLRERGDRIQAIVLGRDRLRRSRFFSWKAGIVKEVAERFVSAEKKLRIIEVQNKNIQKSRDEEFGRLRDLFHIQLRLRAPVKLWEDRSNNHRYQSKKAFAGFTGLVVAAIGAGALIPFFFGDYIAGSFFTEVCSATDPSVCSREFSAKGPLTVAGLLIIMSLLMWAIRLQYRVYLSERHLALDASEKQAFAETFLAIKEGADVSAGSEAIVLASLFRPTQDGIIKDDESGFDLSAASILAKQLGRPGA